MILIVCNSNVDEGSQDDLVDVLAVSLYPLKLDESQVIKEREMVKKAVTATNHHRAERVCQKVVW